MSESNRPDEPLSGISRRQFLKGVSGSVAAAGLMSTGVVPAGAEKAPNGTLGPGAADLTLRVNGQNRRTKAEPRHTLLQVLRDNLDVTGPKSVCDRGSCGGCTVMMDGEPAYACMMLAVDAVGKEITTVEGLAKGDELDPVQKAFVKHDAQMCGFCTPGFVVSVRALLNRNPNPTLDDVKHAVSGNLCRCGTYPRVFEAALTAAKLQRGEAIDG